MKLPEALSTSVIALAVAAALIAVIYFGMDSLNKAHENGTERMQACIDAGGTMSYSQCIL